MYLLHGVDKGKGKVEGKRKECVCLLQSTAQSNGRPSSPTISSTVMRQASPFTKTPLRALARVQRTFCFPLKTVSSAEVPRGERDEAQQAWPAPSLNEQCNTPDQTPTRTAEIPWVPYLSSICSFIVHQLTCPNQRCKWWMPSCRPFIPVTKGQRQEYSRALIHMTTLLSPSHPHP